MSKGNSQQILLDKYIKLLINEMEDNCSLKNFLGILKQIKHKMVMAHITTDEKHILVRGMCFFM